MLRRLLTESPFRPRLYLRVMNSTSSTGQPQITLNEYHESSDGKLEELNDKLEEALEDRYDHGADVSLSNGVLTVVVDDHHTYVINKQTPNRQLWLSSPLSGPKRFDLIGGKWIDKNDRVELDSLLSEELSKLTKIKLDS